MKLLPFAASFALLALLALASSTSFAAQPGADLMRAYGTDMGRAQRCGVAISEILLFSQLAKDLAQSGEDPDALSAAFNGAAAAAREGAAPDCKAATPRFAAATQELYKHTGRQQP